MCKDQHDYRKQPLWIGAQSSKVQVETIHTGYRQQQLEAPHASVLQFRSLLMRFSRILFLKDGLRRK